MDKLPKGWKLVQLGNIAKTTAGGTPNRAKSDYWHGKIPWLKSGELNDSINISCNEEFITEEGLNNSSTKLFKKGTLLLAMYGATAGKLGILGFDSCTNQAVCSIQNVFNEFENKYIFFFLLYIRKKIIEDSSGGAQPNISKKYIDNIQIPLPPLPEQTRIVNKLDSLFERIDKSIALLEENIKHTEALMASVLDEVFGEMEESLFKPILDVCSIYNKTINPKDGEVYNYIGLENIKSVTGRLVDFSPSTGESIKSSKVIFGKNAVLYGKLRPYLNKVWVSDFEGVSTTEILPFKPNNKILDSNYLAFYLRSPKFVNLVNSNTSGARMPRATTGFFKTIAKVPVPELKMQNKILLKLNAVSEKSSKLITEQQSKLNYLKALKASLLDKAFKGEL